MGGLGLFFASVPDPRAANARHTLEEIMVIAFAALLCGAESCVDFAAFGRSRQALLRQVLSLEHGPPSHDTFSRVFRLLDPARFAEAFARFTRRFAERLASLPGAPAPLPGPVVALDGKTIPGAAGRGANQALMMVSAWAADQRLVLSARLAPGRAEARTAREIIALLDLTGTTVTADALHGSRETAAAITDRGGDYALALKANRGPWHREATARFARPGPAGAETIERGHGRRETRRAWVLPVADTAAFGLPGLAAIARIDAERARDGQPPGVTSTRYFLLSRNFDPADALRIVRAHWSIENNQHWMLDVVFAEDRAAVRNDQTAQNLAILRRLALNLLRTDPTKSSLRLKTKRAAWEDTFLLTLLHQMR